MKGQDSCTVGCVCRDAPNVVQVAATSRAPLLVHEFQASQRPRPRPRAFSAPSDAFSARARARSSSFPAPARVSCFDFFRCPPFKRLLEACNLLFERDDILADQGQSTRVHVDLLAKLLGHICKLGNGYETLLVLALQFLAELPIISNQCLISFDRALQVGDFALEVVTGVLSWLRDGAGGWRCRWPRCFFFLAVAAWSVLDGRPFFRCRRRPSTQAWRRKPLWWRRWAEAV